MNIQITGDNYELSENTKKLVDQKVGKKLDVLLSTFAPEMKTASLRIEKDKNNNIRIEIQDK